MPLILSMHKGDDFYVEKNKLVVSHITGEESFTVEVNDEHSFEITAEMQTEVLPDVMLSAGNNAHPGTIRVCVDAPKDQLILRGTKMRQGAQ